MPDRVPLRGTWEEHRAVLEARQPFHDFQYPHANAAGAVQYVSVSGEPVFDAGGRFTGYRGVGQNVSERIEAQEALRMNEEQLRVVTDQAPVLVANRDRKKRYRYVNRPYARTFGLQPADIIGRPAQEVLGEQAYAQARPYMDAALAGQSVECDLTLPAAPGGTRAVHVS